MILGCGVFQPGFETGERGFAIQLFRRAGVAMRQRQIGGLAGVDGKRHADQFGLHRVEPGGFGVERIALARLSSLAIQASSWASVRMVS